MVVVSMLTAEVAAKWILAAKIMLAVGGGLVTASPVLNKAVDEKRKHNTSERVNNDEHF